MLNDSNKVNNIASISLAFSGIILAAFTIAATLYLFYYSHKSDAGNSQQQDRAQEQTVATTEKRKTRINSPSMTSSNPKSLAKTSKGDSLPSFGSKDNTSDQSNMNRYQSDTSDISNNSSNLTNNIKVSRETYYKKLNKSLISLQKAYKVKDSKIGVTDNSTIAAQMEKRDYINDVLAKCALVKQNVAMLEKNFNTSTVNKLVSENNPRYDFSLLAKVHNIEIEFIRLRDSK